MSGADTSCTKCNRGSLLLGGQSRRKIEVEGASVDVPRGFMIPTCDHCGAEQLDDEWKESLLGAIGNARVAALRSARTEKMSIIAPPMPEDATITIKRGPTPTSFGIGELVADTYEIVRVIGVGGMGTVYEAHDRALNRRVALKVAQSPSPEHTLRKEAQALAAIRHPSMVTVHAVGQHRGIEFLVMELIR